MSAMGFAWGFQSSLDTVSGRSSRAANGGSSSSGSGISSSGGGEFVAGGMDARLGAFGGAGAMGTFPTLGPLEQTGRTTAMKRRTFAGDDEPQPEQQQSDDETCGSRRVSTRRRVMAPLQSAQLQSQPLPIRRGLELMDKEQLASLVMELVQLDPQVQNKVQRQIQRTKFKSDQYMDILQDKFNKVLQHVPYNRKFESASEYKLDDYSFVRLKPFILEFLDCLIDYNLNSIPCDESQGNQVTVQEALNFLDQCTEMLTSLPRFDLPSNNYYYDKCFEQISYIWCVLIEQFLKDPVLAINGLRAPSSQREWVHKLQHYNDRSRGLLRRPLQMLESWLNVTNGDTNGTSINAVA
ncbi:Sts1p KNAG_0L01130 [Huiozyma naganishii CBS 8797]|uniref:Tethering factor for nuclear proteasome STS1 n=1 Tax=Huiozyma naganishii (strain ATCC MYA-139 / BCRC 22969 / CBS 8797 / KCTC 17520 / NBRC 10181 / NCYC 3082 / Yp74L-3) TaxID=1071383 RepID=J7RS59_HUIN7|nr:hypothetical protein KNAG_0L01130 [Kazachstania naganishii CBS 8797]CCK72733.1 hypothetical protein KNAG_0L01130 [Kazachstania naganishii CBS 8797]